MAEPATVCVIEGEASFRQKISAILDFIDFTSVTFADPLSWREQISAAQQHVDIVLIDVRDGAPESIKTLHEHRQSYYRHGQTHKGRTCEPAKRAPQRPAPARW